MDMKKKNIILSMVVIMVGIMVAGGTFAYLTFSINFVNNVVSGETDCFSVDYSINNDDGTQDITGTLFPTVGPSKGLFGKVSINMNSNCNMTGTGTLYLKVNSGTSTMFGTVASGHCEDNTYLTTMNDYKSESACTAAGGTWISSGTVLKYAVYSSSNTESTPLRVGYFNNNAIGSQQVLYDGFDVNKTKQNYYIYLWLDGYLTDNNYTNLPFSGSIDARVVQNAS